ncbi:VanW family protein [Streptomyces sp. NPDC000594]|uniref:VanW family protein n=1 Tax=Streptomyces sp. NPDC000594 TaxID=3154261 RepID=UPI00332FF475
MGLGFGGLYLTGLLAFDGEVPAGTRVHGVDIGGLGSAAAERKLERELGPRWPAPVEVGIGDRTGTVDAREAGFTLDSRETVERAARSGSDPFTVIGRLFSSGDREIEPVQRVDGAKTEAAVAALAKKYDRTAREGAISFRDGRAVPVQARVGERIDAGPAADAIRTAMADGTTDTVDLPVRRTEPKVGAAEVNRAMDAFARPAMSAPVTVTVEDRSATITPAVIGRHLTMKPDKSDRLVPKLDGAALRKDPAVERALDTVIEEPVEGTLGLQGDRVVLASDGRSGQKVSADGLERTVTPLLTGEGTAARTAALRTTEVRPALDAKSFDSLGLKERMSSFTVDFDPAPYRTKNIGRAVELINGSLVKPGEEWSFNRTVGERTEANGFVDGIIIQDDQYTKAAGGGVSAVATTMFNAVFFAGVKPVEYGAHSFYIERYPEGREATVAWGSLDLRFLNDSGNSLYIAASSTDSSVTISFYGSKKYDSVKAVKGPRTDVKEPGKRKGPAENCLPQTPLDGFNVTVERVLSNDGEEVKREAFNTRYVPRDEVTCEKPITL